MPKVCPSPKERAEIYLHILRFSASIKEILQGGTVRGAQGQCGGEAGGGGRVADARHGHQRHLRKQVEL